MTQRRAAIVIPRPTNGTLPPRPVQEALSAIKQRIESLESGSEKALGLMQAQRRLISATAVQNAPAPPPAQSGGGGVAADRIEVQAGASSVQPFRAVASMPGGFVHADRETGAHAGRVAGLSLTGATPNRRFDLLNSGVATNVNWNWSVGDILYVGANGALTTDDGNGDFDQMVGIAISARRVLLLLAQPYLLDDAPAARFLLRSGDVQREAEAVATATANAIARTGADGRFDRSLIPAPRILAVAATSVTALHAVTITGDEAAHADAGTIGHMNRVAGVAVNGASAEDVVRIAYNEVLTDAGWSWTPGGPVYLGLAGALTQSSDVGAFQQRIGFAASATSLLIQIGEGIAYA